MVDIIKKIDKRFTPDREVYKTKYGTSYKMRRWGYKRDNNEDAFVYRIPPGNGERNIRASTFIWAYEQLLKGKDLRRKDLPEKVRLDLKNCNFNVLGGIFHRLGYAKYKRGQPITSKCSKKK